MATHRQEQTKNRNLLSFRSERAAADGIGAKNTDDEPEKSLPLSRGDTLDDHDDSVMVIHRGQRRFHCTI